MEMCTVGKARVIDDLFCGRVRVAAGTPLRCRRVRAWQFARSRSICEARTYFAPADGGASRTGGGDSLAHEQGCRAALT